MEYIIQMRVTRTSDKHVCNVCGKDAYLCAVGYEATTQELADQLSVELQQAETWEQVRAIPLHSKASDAVFDATVEEQRLHGPREHDRFYECANCFGSLLSAVMGNDSGSITLAVLLKQPAGHALFCARKIDTPGQCLLVIGNDHDPLLALEALKDEETPRFKKM